jgi:peptidylprolyl isomerase
MAQAQNGDAVKVRYTGKLHDGTIFESSEERDGLEFQLGGQQILPGVEKAVVGMSVGESKTITIAASDAYGPHRPELTVAVKRSDLPDDIEPEVGRQLVVRQPSGKASRVTVTDVDEESVTLDGNHPLAGKDLTFDLQLLEIG